MAEKTRTCPACGGTMTLRLGEYQCQQCDHSMAAAPVEEPKKSSGYSAPTYGGSSSYGAGSSKPTLPSGPTQGQSQWDPGAQYRNAPPPPPPGAMLGGGSDIYAPERAVKTGDGLTMEKNIYFGIACLGGLLQVIGGFAGAGSSPLGAGPGVGSIIGALIGLGILYWVLFGEELWAKWACAGCQGIGLISVFGLVASGGSMLASMPQLQGVDPGAISSFLLVLGLVQIAWVGWFISILMRDISQRQGV